MPNKISFIVGHNIKNKKLPEINSGNFYFIN